MWKRFIDDWKSTREREYEEREALMEKVGLDYEGMYKQAECTNAALAQAHEELANKHERVVQTNTELVRNNTVLEAENKALRFCIERFTANK